MDNFVRHLAAYLAERWDKMYPGWGNPIEIYLKAAEEGYAAAQFIVGLAHLEGDGIEKNGPSVYYWLRMAEENSSAVRQRSRALIEDLRAKISPDEIDQLERTVSTGRRKILAGKTVNLFSQALPVLSDRQAG